MFIKMLSGLHKKQKFNQKEATACSSMLDRDESRTSRYFYKGLYAKNVGAYELI